MRRTMVHIGRALLLASALALAGCGTDVLTMVKKESQITWDAHSVAFAASKLDQGLEKRIYDAEFAKVKACRQVDKGVSEYIENYGRITFFEQLKADFTRLLVFVFPVTSIENCADAYNYYVREYLTLSARLKALNMEPKTAE